MEGYPTFVCSILMIGLNTAVIGDVAGHLGCFIYLKDSVNAIAFVALGTSVPGRDHLTIAWSPCLMWSPCKNRSTIAWSPFLMWSPCKDHSTIAWFPFMLLSICKDHSTIAWFSIVSLHGFKRSDKIAMDLIFLDLPTLTKENSFPRRLLFSLRFFYKIKGIHLTVLINLGFLRFKL